MATILVVDDQTVIQRTLKYMLAKDGHEVLTAGSGPEALDILAAANVDLVFCDLSMPDMDGITLLRQLRADSRYEGLPVVMLTASGRDEDQARSLSEGATAFLTKPASTAELIRVTHEVLRGRDS